MSVIIKKYGIYVSAITVDNVKGYLSFSSDCDFSSTCLFDAYTAAEASALNVGTFVQSMPEVLALRIELPFTHPAWLTSYTCASEEDVGTTAHGNKVVIVDLGGVLL